MSNRISGLTIILAEDTREEDADQIVQALNLMRGVIAVSKVVTTSESFFLKQQVKSEIAEKLWKTLNES